MNSGSATRRFAARCPFFSCSSAFARAPFRQAGQRILDLTRRDFLELLAREGLPLYDPSEQELADELQTVQRLGPVSDPAKLTALPAALDAGAREVIALADERHTDLVIMDEAAGGDR